MGKLSGPYSVSVEVVVDLGDLLKCILNHLAKPAVLKSEKLTRNFEINNKRVYCITSNGECSDQTTLSYQMQYFSHVV